jgi:hypothetical protein
MSYREKYTREEFMEKEEKLSLLEEAIKKYPIGTKFRVAHRPSEIKTVSSHTYHTDTFVENRGLHINFLVKEERGGASVYYDGKWAEIVEYPKQRQIQGYKAAIDQPKAPIYTYCKVNKHAIEALAMRALNGHEKYKKYDEDFKNFIRVENGDYHYSNAEFRHALEIGDDEDEEQHLIAAAWNAVARLEIFLLNKKEKQ